MASLVVLYKTPKDPAAFDKHYSEKHIALAKKIPGLRRYEISRGPVRNPRGSLRRPSRGDAGVRHMAAIQSGLASPEGQAAAGDVPNFATGGADMLMFDSKDA